MTLGNLKQAAFAIVCFKVKFALSIQRDYLGVTADNGMLRAVMK